MIYMPNVGNNVERLTQPFSVEEIKSLEVIPHCLLRAGFRTKMENINILCKITRPPIYWRSITNRLINCKLIKVSVPLDFILDLTGAGPQNSYCALFVQSKLKKKTYYVSLLHLLLIRGA